MSASTERSSRQTDRYVGSDRKTLSSQKEAQKKKKENFYYGKKKTN